MKKEEVQIMSSKNRQEGRNDSPMRDIPDQVGMLEQEESANDGNEKHSPDGGQDLIQVMVTTLSEPDLGATIRRLRESRQLSLKEVAARSGLTQSFLSQVEVCNCAARATGVPRRFRPIHAGRRR